MPKTNRKQPKTNDTRRSYSQCSEISGTDRCQGKQKQIGLQHKILVREIFC